MQYNWLSELLPPAETVVWKLLRQALIGFCASAVSDTISNSLRVLKTYRQVNQSRVSYRAAALRIIQTEGWLSLFGRGLGTRILANGIQGIMFSVLWKVRCSSPYSKRDCSLSRSMTALYGPLVYKACLAAATPMYLITEAM